MKSSPPPPLGSWRLLGILLLSGGSLLAFFLFEPSLESPVGNEYIAFLCGSSVTLAGLGLGYLLWGSPKTEGRWPENWFSRWLTFFVTAGLWLVFVLLFRAENEFQWSSSMLLATVIAPAFVYFVVRIFRNALKD